MSLKGEIDVERCMAFVERQKRECEWVVLKAYWRAEPEERWQVEVLFGETLRRGLKKWMQKHLKGWHRYGC